jgi:PhnB protein
MHLNTYVHFIGNCAEAFYAYAKILNTNEMMMMQYGEAPDQTNIVPEQRDKIMHASIKVGDTLLMGSDGPPGYHQIPAGFSVSVNLTDEAEAVRIFDALAEGGEIRMALQQTFWAKRFGMLKDRFGVPWMINCEPAG